MCSCFKLGLMLVKIFFSVMCLLNWVGVEFIKLIIVCVVFVYKKVDSFLLINIELVVFIIDLYLCLIILFCWRLWVVDKLCSILWKLRYVVNLLFMNLLFLLKCSLSSFWFVCFLIIV